MAEYPATIAAADIVAVLDGEHYNITSPRSARDWAAALPGAKWDPKGRCWQVKKRWHATLAREIAAYGFHRAEELSAQVASARQAEADRREAGRAAMAAMTPFKGGASITVARNQIIVSTAYHPEIVGLMRRLGGKFDSASKAWRLPIEAGVEIAAARNTIRDWHNATVNRATAADAEHAVRRASRVLERAAHPAPVGAVMKWRGEWVTVESHGKWFTADDDLSSLGYGTGLEGESVRYAYTRPATAAEIATAEAAEASRAEATARRRERTVAVAAVAHGEAAPDTGAEPAGEVIWRDDENAATGHRRWIVMTDDGWLYHLTYDGGDGATWGNYNAGYNTRATRVTATPELVAAIRGAQSA